MLLGVWCLVAVAQDEAPAEPSERIAAGDTITAEITDEVSEIEYAFSGTEAEAIVFEMVAVDPLGELSTPRLVLRDDVGNVLNDTGTTYSFFGEFSGAYLAVVLPYTGEYVLVATRYLGPEGPGTGAFTLRAVSPISVDFDTIVRSTLSNADDYDYYLYRESSDFQVQYTHLEGRYHPEVAVNRIEPYSGALDGIAYLTGREITAGTLGVFPGGETYLITVGDPISPVLNPVTLEGTVIASYQLILLRDR